MANGRCVNSQVMTKTILICGFGPGISLSVAEKFGAQGFSLALAARSGQGLATGVGALESKGFRATAFQADLSDLQAVARLVKDVHDRVGPIDALHYNAYSNGAGNVLTADLAELRTSLDLGVTSLAGLVQAALPDLRERKGAVLVTNGGLGALSPQVDANAAQFNVMGLAIANAAKHKLVRLLSEKLKADGVYVGEVVVMGAVKGSAWDSGNATITASGVADRFWQLYSERKELSVPVA